MKESYEIFKKYPDGMFIWIESVESADSGKMRLKQLAESSPGEYKLFCQQTCQVVAAEETGVQK
jgi:hypothetical protein